MIAKALEYLINEQIFWFTLLIPTIALVLVTSGIQKCVDVLSGKDGRKKGGGA